MGWKSEEIRTPKNLKLSQIHSDSNIAVGWVAMAIFGSAKKTMQTYSDGYLLTSNFLARPASHLSANTLRQRLDSRESNVLSVNQAGA